LRARRQRTESEQRKTHSQPHLSEATIFRLHIVFAALCEERGDA
jgi:hypothetical protein